MKNTLKNFYAGKRVFITGHTGFKGSWLSYWLHLLGAEVHGYALESDDDFSLFNRLELKKVVNHTVSDIRDLDKLSVCMKKFNPEIVIHLAAQSLVKKSYEEPISTFGTNVMGSLNLMESVRNIPSVKSLVFITSDKCYWNKEWVWGYRETDELGGIDPYSASKACAEHVFKSYYLSYFKLRENFGCGSARAGNVIGGGDTAKDRIVPDIIKFIENNSAIVLRNPSSTRPWQHVLDPLNGYLMLAKKLYEDTNLYNGESWNFGPSNQSIKTVYDLTRKITSIWGSVDINCDEKRSHHHEAQLLHLSIEKAKNLLEWSPKMNFDESVIKTGEWYKRVFEGESPKLVTEEQIIHFMSK